jgi:hypothetical protein
VPTISETSGVAIPWAVDGHSFWDEQHEQPQVTIFTGDGLATAPVVSLEQKRDALLQRQVRFFGERDDEPGVYGIGPHPELIGRPVSDLQQEPSTGLGATLAGEVKALLADWPRGSRAVPTPIYGSLEGDEAGETLPIAVAVNGRIAAVSWTDGSGSETYSTFVPEAAFHPGRNRVAVFAIEEGADGVTLARLGSA